MRMKPLSAAQAAPTRDSQAGFSLLEVLVAVALMGVIGIGILPLFVRAVESTTAGGRSTDVSTFALADVERINQQILDHPDYRMVAGGVVDFGLRFWDAGSLDGNVLNFKMGDEEWVEEDDVDSSSRLYLYTRQMKVRKYSYADIHPGLLQIQTPEGGGGGDPAIQSSGHSMLFDRPLQADADGNVSNAHITEVRVYVKPNREEVALGYGQRVTVSNYRAY